ncbi:MAG: ABC transporter ATP-binding protein [Solirubrobacterales bacterium]|nr:ABC transporter ATP-binding protein [Solirubrobacterales bacterium]
MGDSHAAVLSATGLAHRYGDRVAVHDADLSLYPGELVALTGPNGAGKTTLLSLLAGILEPSGGSVAVSGRVGWVPQQPALYAKLTVAENLALFARLENVPDVQKAVDALLHQTGLWDRSDEQVGRLSGGNRQRVNVAIGLLGDPAVLLLDEPSASLDPEQRERLWSFVAGFVEAGTAVLFSTHDMAEAWRPAQRVLSMQDGALSEAER